MRRWKINAVALVGLLVQSSIAAACPAWFLTPAFGEVEIDATAGQTTYSRNDGITAGGSRRLSDCGFEWVGWVSTAPDFDLYYTTSGEVLTITLEIPNSGGMQPVLLINDPDGTWHFDNGSSGEGNATIIFTAPKSGLYDMWFGTLESASGQRARLAITVGEGR